MTCVCGFACRLAPTTAAYHRAHRAVHLEVFPASSAETIANLDALVSKHERRESPVTERAS